MALLFLWLILSGKAQTQHFDGFRHQLYLDVLLNQKTIRA